MTSRIPRTAALLLIALGAIVAVALVSVAMQGPKAAVGKPAPPVIGQTIDGDAFDLASVRGRPIVLNFGGPSCIPCRNEFPLFTAKLAEHASVELAIVGVLEKDTPEDARDFVAEFAASWPTVIDPTQRIANAYRYVARPQTYFIDGDGIVRSIQIGELTEADFERQFAKIAA